MKLTSAIALAIALAPAAVAQPVDLSCELLQGLVEAAPNGFEAHRGDLIPGTGNGFYSKLLVNDYVCAVVFSPDDHGFICYTSDAVSLADGQTAYAATVDLARTCFPSWTTAPTEQVDDPAITEISGLRFMRKTADTETGIGLILAREGAVEAGQHRYSFGITWRSLPTGA